MDIHFPSSLEAQKDAYRRIAFEEFLMFQVSILLRRLSITTQEGIEHTVPAEFVQQFEKAFEFTLTKAQQRVIRDIAKDMAAPHPMHRLLQGDVGSGKTVAAFFGCLLAVANGRQAVLMAPTEILAHHHYEKIQRIGKRLNEVRNKGI